MSGFRPSRDGFAFRNGFAGSPLPPMFRQWHESLGAPNHFGLCGGMSLAAADLFISDTPPPQILAAPQQGTPLFEYLYRRQAESLGPGGIMATKFAQWMLLPDQGSGGSLSLTGQELPEIARLLDLGEFVLLGLVLQRAGEPGALLWENHQVLAYAIDRTVDRAQVSVYDPNFPGEDGVKILMNSNARGGITSIRRVVGVPDGRGTAVRGVFLIPAKPRRVSSAEPWLEQKCPGLPR